MLEKVLLGLTAAIGVIVLAGLIAVFGGTLVWALWDVVPTAFPGLVESGTIANELEWWDSVKLTWLFALLIKGSSSTSSSKS